VIKRGLVAVHRWLGVALALNVFVWFTSGIGMMYWDFPSVSSADRLARSPTLDVASLHVSLADAFDTAGFDSVDEARLETFDGRPVYRLRNGRTARVVYADTGEMRRAVSREQADRIAARWSGQNIAAATVRAADEVDQWTVQLPLARLRPVWQYTWPHGEQVYVSQASGEVIQYTTRASRLGAYVGAIPHWLYVTPLRKHGPVWSRLVIALSASATVVAAFGLTIGVWAFSPSRRYRHAGVPVRIPYRGWKRWHAILGLVLGVTAMTWAFSGMLSMDPFPLPGDPPQTGNIEEVLRGTIQKTAFDTLTPAAALASLGDAKVKQLDCVLVGAQPLYVATLESGDTRIVSLTGDTRSSFEVPQIAALVGAAVHPDEVAGATSLDDYDRYYLDRHRGRPLPVVLVRLGDRDASRFYIDPKTARLVGAYHARNWVTRWLYHGLHSLDFPWLYRYRPLWDVIVGAFMLGGTALCCTSLVLGWQTLARSLGRPSTSTNQIRRDALEGRPLQ
jgi:PepSY-associated TM region